MCVCVCVCVCMYVCLLYIYYIIYHTILYTTIPLHTYYKYLLNIYLFFSRQTSDAQCMFILLQMKIPFLLF